MVCCEVCTKCRQLHVHNYGLLRSYHIKLRWNMRNFVTKCGQVRGRRRRRRRSVNTFARLCAFFARLVFNLPLTGRHAERVKPFSFPPSSLQRRTGGVTFTHSCCMQEHSHRVRTVGHAESKIPPPKKTKTALNGLNMSRRTSDCASWKLVPVPNWSPR